VLEDESKQLIPVPFENSIEAFNKPLASFLDGIGLPIENVFVAIDERLKVLRELETALEILPLDERAKAYYLSKFSVAVTVGLFDAAVNYLWNETIGALRRLVVDIDLEHFFNVAEKTDPKRWKLTSADDLGQIGDHTLLESCRRIGLISDVNFERLHHINYMRNYASAAHPTDISIDGYELLSWLSNCLQHIICAQPDHSVIVIKRFLYNLRSVAIPSSDLLVIANEIERLPQEQIDDLIWTMFGMYTDPRRVEEISKKNITGLAKSVWAVTSEDRKFEIGSKYGFFIKNAEVDRKNAASDFFDIVAGQRYKSEDVLAIELLDKLDTLKKVHFGLNNFYNEYAHAKSLRESFPLTGSVPRAARPIWVKVICLCYVGNGLGHKDGVDESASVYYKEYIEAFGEIELIEFLHLFSDSEFTVDLGQPKAEERMRELAQFFKSKFTSVYIQRVLDLIISTPPKTLRKIAEITEYKEALKYVPKQPSI